MQHLAIYVRVSHRSQDTRSQEPDLERYVAANADKAVVWYRDTYTGRTMNRPGWDRLMEAVRAGHVSSIVCWRLDRLGRTARGLTALFDELVTKRINLVSMRDGVDLNTAGGRMVANILASISQFELELRAERVAAGQAAARAAGKTWGGSKPGRRWKVSDEQVQAIHEMVRAKKKIAAIARATGLSRQTIYQYIPAA